MPPQIRSISFVSPTNHPILIRAFSTKHEDILKQNYAVHCSLDVIEERIAAAGKATECYLGLLYSIEDVAVYAYTTTLKVKIVLALALSDAIVKDLEVITICKALHMAFYKAVSNPFLRLDAPTDAVDHMLVGNDKWKGLRKHVDEIARLAGTSF